MLVIILLFFLLFALSRVLLQLRNGNITVGTFTFWSSIFISAAIGIAYPEITGQLASALGIGRGVDVVIYISIALLFYLIFRLSIMIEDLRHEISQLIRELAMDNIKKPKKTK